MDIDLSHNPLPSHPFPPSPAALRQEALAAVAAIVRLGWAGVNGD